MIGHFSLFRVCFLPGKMVGATILQQSMGAQYQVQAQYDVFF